MGRRRFRKMNRTVERVLMAPKITPQSGQAGGAVSAAAHISIWCHVNRWTNPSCVAAGWSFPARPGIPAGSIGNAGVDAASVRHYLDGVIAIRNAGAAARVVRDLDDVIEGFAILEGDVDRAGAGSRRKQVHEPAVPELLCGSAALTQGGRHDPASAASRRKDGDIVGGNARAEPYLHLTGGAAAGHGGA